MVFIESHSSIRYLIARQSPIKRKVDYDKLESRPETGSGLRLLGFQSQNILNLPPKNCICATLKYLALSNFKEKWAQAFSGFRLMCESSIEPKPRPTGLGLGLGLLQLYLKGWLGGSNL